MTPYEHPRDYAALCAAVDQRAGKAVMQGQCECDRLDRDPVRQGEFCDPCGRSVMMGDGHDEPNCLRCMQGLMPLPEAEAGWALLEWLGSRAVTLALDGVVTFLPEPHADDPTTWAADIEDGPAKAGTGATPQRALFAAAWQMVQAPA